MGTPSIEITYLHSVSSWRRKGVIALVVVVVFVVASVVAVVVVVAAAVVVVVVVVAVVVVVVVVVVAVGLVAVVVVVKRGKSCSLCDTRRIIIWTHACIYTYIYMCYHD